MMIALFLIILGIVALVILGGIIMLTIVSIVLLCKKKIKGFAISFCALLVFVYLASCGLYNISEPDFFLPFNNPPYHNTEVQITGFTNDDFFINGEKYVFIENNEFDIAHDSKETPVANYGTRSFLDIIFFKNDTETLYQYTTESGHDVVIFLRIYYCKEADKAAILNY